MEKNIFNVAGHTVEIRYSPTGMYDPWTLDYARKKGVSMMCTSDTGQFLLVDGEYVYKLRCGRTISFARYIENDVIDSSEMFDLWLEEVKEEECGTLSDWKRRIDEMKEKEDAYNRLSPEEKEQYKRDWLARREENLKKNKN